MKSAGSSQRSRTHQWKCYIGCCLAFKLQGKFNPSGILVSCEQLTPWDGRPFTPFLLSTRFIAWQRIKIASTSDCHFLQDPKAPVEKYEAKLLSKYDQTQQILFHSAEYLARCGGQDIVQSTERPSTGQPRLVVTS